MGSSGQKTKGPFANICQAYKNQLCADLLHHLCIHHKAELEADYGPAILANQCGLCTFASRSATDIKKKYAMMRHIGAVHRKVLDYARE